MTRRNAVLCMSALVVLLAAGVRTASAQEAGAARPATPDAEKQIEAYRLDFLISELEDGKRINSRQYSVYVNVNDGKELKIGTRIPVETKDGEFQYLDVGTNLFARIVDRRGQLELTASADISSLAVPEQSTGREMRPIVRQVKINASTLLMRDKPMVMAVVDDPNSKRQYQLDVTATKLR